MQIGKRAFTQSADFKWNGAWVAYITIIIINEYALFLLLSSDLNRFQMTSFKNYQSESECRSSGKIAFTTDLSSVCPMLPRQSLPNNGKKNISLVNCKWGGVTLNKAQFDASLCFSVIFSSYSHWFIRTCTFAKVYMYSTYCNTTEKRENKITTPALAVNNCFTKLSISTSSIIECVSHSKPIQSKRFHLIFCLLIIQWQRKFIILFVTKGIQFKRWMDENYFRVH